MPFGLCNAPNCFQRAMNDTLGDLRWTSCLVYMDDVIVYGKSFEEMVNNLKRVMEKLSAVGMRLNLKKCDIGKRQIEYLGHVVGKEYPCPQNSKQLQQFLGLASYYRRFIKGFSKITNPMRSLLKKDSVWQWNREQDVAFSLLKEKLMTSSTLATFHSELLCEIRTDASGNGLGAILLQRNGKGEVNSIVSYASRFLSDAEQRYSVTEKEALAVLWAVTDKFRPYMEGKNFVVVTDHSALVWRVKSD
ncbi:Uncharacterised protein r2_g291 [Pycnogonum litorale]